MLSCISALLILRLLSSDWNCIPTIGQMEKLNHVKVNLFAKDRKPTGDKAHVF